MTTCDAKKDVNLQNMCMHMACIDAMSGVELGHGGPFGAMVRRNGRTISTAHNTVLTDCDPTCHAEMNAIRDACQRLQTHDLSDCELYTSCEPCPMCLGGIMWSRINKIYIAADRLAAAEYGFDDKVFYDEVAAFFTPGKDRKAQMLRVIRDVGLEDVKRLFADPSVNRTYKRRKGMSGLADTVATEDVARATSEAEVTGNDLKYMQLAIKAAEDGVKNGANKEHEPFGACIVHTTTGEVVATACNTVLASRDATATAEINAIRQASAKLQTYVLDECVIYCTAVPDMMSFGALLWSRIPQAYCGASLQWVAVHGFEERLSHYQQLLEVPPQDRKMTVVKDVLKSKSEEVFQYWKAAQGQLY